MRRSQWKWMAALAMLCGTTARAVPNDNFKFCYSPAFAGWRNFLEPCIDGVIDGADLASCPPDNDGNSRAGKPETGWSNAFSYTFNTGVVVGGKPVNDVVIHALANSVPSMHLDLGVEVKNDKTFDDSDLVVFAFEFSGNRYGAVAIRPNANGIGALVPADPTRVEYYAASSLTVDGRPQWGPAGKAPNFITYAASSNGNACENAAAVNGACTWNVEVKIQVDAASPNNGSGNMPPPIRTYFGVSRVYHVGASITDSAAEEFAWPPTNPNGDDPLLFKDISNVPPPQDFGKATVNSTSGCNGLSFGPGDITVNPAPVVGHQSTLSVAVHNNSMDGTTGNPVPAGNVTAAFFHAHFGSQSFAAFDPAGNPSAATTIAAGTGTNPIVPGTTVLSTQWTPTAASDHECVLARISSTSNGVTIVNGGEFINTAVAAMSTATIAPVISMKGARPRAGGGPQKIRVTPQKRFQFAYADGSLPEIPAGTLVAQLDWLFFVARDTGRTITITQGPIPVVEPMPGYDTVFQHAMAPDFQKAFEGRHPKEVSIMSGRFATFEMSMAQRIRIANGLLAGIDEKPDPATFQVEAKGLTSVAGSKTVFAAEIPEGGELTVPTTATFNPDGKSGGGFLSCFSCLQTKNTPAFLFFTFAMIAVAGVFAYRRRP